MSRPPFGVTALSYCSHRTKWPCLHLPAPAILSQATIDAIVIEGELVICILRFKPLTITAKSVDRRWLPHPADQIDDWILAADVQEAREHAMRQPEQQELVTAVSQMELLPPGKHRLSAGYIALIF